MPVAVFFDVGNTLLTPDPSMEGIFIDVASQWGYRLSKELVGAHIPEMFDYYEQLYSEDDSFWCSGDRAEMIWIEMYKMLCLGVGIADESEAVARAMHEECMTMRSWRMFSDVIPCLDTLRDAGVPMGLISNWDNSLIPIAEGIGLADYMTTIISSADVGLRKPDPAIFDLAMRNVGVEATCSIHVGDHLYADVMGSRKVGMHPVYINRAGGVTPGNVTTIDSLASLPAIVRRLTATLDGCPTGSPMPGERG
jgi:putative hydrolase of the HAD superfamily